MALQINDGNLSEILATNKLVVVDFWAEWCGPCRMLGPIVDELSTEITDVAIGKLNVSDNAMASSNYGITSIPTLLFFKDGEVVDTVKGVLSKSALKKKIEDFKG
jgi:thioredoxin 1